MKAVVIATTDRLRRPRRGFNLIESLVGVSVLAIATTAIIVPISAVQVQSRAVDEVETATALARQLIEEIASKPLHDPVFSLSGAGPETGETTRAQYSNIDDYDGYADTSATLAALNGLSAAVPDDRGVYKRKVKVRYRASPDGVATVSYSDFAVATVTVTTPGGQDVSVQRLFASYGRK